MSSLFPSTRQIWQMTPLIDTLPVCLFDKKRAEQNGEQEGCFPRRLECVKELFIPIYTGVCTHSFVYIGRNYCVRMENVFSPVKAAELSYRHQMDKTFVVMVDNYRDEAEIPKACNSLYVVKTNCSTDFSDPGSTYFWLRRAKGLCNYTSDGTDRFQIDVIL